MEIEPQTCIEDQRRELSGASDAEEEEPKDDGKTPRWGSRLKEDSGVDEAWAAIEADVPSTAIDDESDAEEIEIEVEELGEADGGLVAHASTIAAHHSRKPITTAKPQKICSPTAS